MFAWWFKFLYWMEKQRASYREVSRIRRDEYIKRLKLRSDGAEYDKKRINEMAVLEAKLAKLKAAKQRRANVKKAKTYLSPSKASLGNTGFGSDPFGGTK